jgi:hypothetical protein
MIYFMQSTEGGSIKIGYTCDLRRRHKQLEKHYGCQLAVLATMPGDLDEEAEIHERFAHLRHAKACGEHRRPELFRPAADLMEFIGRPLLVGANPDAVECLNPVQTRVRLLRSERRKPGPKPDPDHARSAVVSIRSRPEWKEWLEEFAKYSEQDLSDLIDDALQQHARTRKFKVPPRR